MARLIHRDVQFTEQDDIGVFVREINDRLRDLTNMANINRTESGSGQVIFNTAANATTPVWLANGDFDLVEVTAVVSTGTGNLTPRIAGVDVGGVAFAVTTTPTVFDITSPNTIVPKDLIDIVTTGLTGTLTLSFGLRRIR